MMVCFIKKVLIICIFLSCISMQSSKMPDSNFIVEYFHSKNIKQLVTFACWDKNDVFDHAREIIRAYKSVSYNAIEGSIDMRSILKVNYYKIGIILDLDCSQSKMIFDQFSTARLPFNESYNWLVITAATEFPVLPFQNLPFTVESEVTVALIQNLHYALYDIFNPSYRHGGKLNITSMGHWSAKSGLINNLSQYKYLRRQNFHGMTLNFSYNLMHEPVTDLETYLSTPINIHHDHSIRFHYVLILYLRDMFNFTINLKRASSWGYLINGTYTGIMGEMMKGIVDISVSSFSYRIERLDIIEYTVETYVVNHYVMFRHPKINSIRNPFLIPFKKNVWWITLMVCLCVWILLVVSVKVESKFKIRQDPVHISNAVSETALITIAAISQQGFGIGPNVYSGRIIFLTLFIWGLLMYQFYSASIVGSLLTTPSKFINSIKAIANSDLKVECEEAPYMEDFFTRNTNPAIKYLWNKKIKPRPTKMSWATTAVDGLKSVAKGGYALFIDSITAYKIIEETYTQDQICDLTEVRLVPPLYLTIGTSKKSPFKKMVVYSLRKMVQSGITTRLFRIWNHRRPRCPESYRSQPVPVSIQEFSPALILIIVAFAFVICFVMIERVTNRYKKRVVNLLKKSKSSVCDEVTSQST